jgi:hypothetical protein
LGVKNTKLYVDFKFVDVVLNECLEKKEKEKPQKTQKFEQLFVCYFFRSIVLTRISAVERRMMDISKKKLLLLKNVSKIFCAVAFKVSKKCIDDPKDLLGLTFLWV